MGRKIKLVYMYICENNIFKKTEINFAKEYEISLNDSLTEIYIRENQENKKREEELYDSHINSFTALVGENGSGKTTILDCLGTQDWDKRHPNFTLFILYKELDSEYWYLEIHYGNKGDCPRFNFVDENIIKTKKNSMYRDFEEKHLLPVKYCTEEKKLHLDSEMDKSRDTSDKFYHMETTKFINYLDRSTKLARWVKDSELESWEDSCRPWDIESDFASCDIAELYSFISHKSETIKKILKNKRDYEGEIILNRDLPTISWNKHNKIDNKKAFIINMLYTICLVLYNPVSQKEIMDMDNANKTKSGKILYSVEKYETYKAKLNGLILRHNYEYSEPVNRLIDDVASLKDDYFVSNDCIHFNASKTFDPLLYKTIGGLNGLFNEGELFTLSYDYMSAGEVKSLEVLSSVYKVMKMPKGNLDWGNPNLIVILDEPDKGMHPELARKLISVLDRFARELGGERTFQFIISTHSPFVILDIPDTNVYRLKIEANDNEKRTYVESGNLGIMSNVVDLIKDSFFLESIFGELCEEYFKRIQDDIAGLDCTGLDCNSREDVIKDIRRRIELISESSLRQFLYSRLEEKLEGVYPNEELITYYINRIKDLEKRK